MTAVQRQHLQNILGLSSPPVALPLPGAKAFWSPSKSDMCVCIPEPGKSVLGFGMNVAYIPRCAAISLTIRR